MATDSAIAGVLADIVVIALTLGVLVCLALAMWLIVVVVLRVLARMRPAPRRVTKVTAELGPDGRDSGRTRIGS